ncbi:hypothetical protein, partial [Methylobacterium crusticola]
MPFTTVQARTQFSGFSGADQSLILGAMQTAYDGSPNARTLFDNWLADPSHTIDVTYVANAFQARLNTGRVEIDLAFLTNATYISDKGTAVKDTLLTALVHELGHALGSTSDNYNVAKPDYKGDNVSLVNKIYKDLGVDEQVSYIAYDDSGLYHKLGFQYTNGTAIDAAVTVITGSKYAPSGNFNSANALATKDLLIGDKSNNTLQSGSGNDYLYGDGGDDNLDGGDGTSDVAVYFNSPLDYDIKQNVNGSWTVRNVRGAKDSGTDTLKNIEKIQFDTPVAGQKVFDLKKNGLTFQTDFGIVIDTTGSMGSSINSVKANASALIDKAFASGNADARIGVVGFKDTTNGEPSSVLLPFTDQDSFADRKAAAQAAINRITVGGGGDIPETAYDGLRVALDGHMGAWRGSAGILRIALFTDAPAKDGAIAGVVSSLAQNIGATISSGASLRGAGGSLDSFDLTVPGVTAAASGRSDPGDPNAPPSTETPLSDNPIATDSTTAKVEIYTIFTGPTGTDTSALKAIADANGGSLLTAPTNDDLVNALLSIIAAPPVDTVDPSVVAVTYGTNDGSLAAGESVTIFAEMSEAVTIAGEGLTLRLNDGGIAVYDPASSSSTVLAFKYTASTGENTDDLAVVDSVLNGAAVRDAAGNSADLAALASNPTGILSVDTIAPEAPNYIRNPEIAVVPVETGGFLSYSIDGGPFSTTFDAASVGGGTHLLVATQTDAAGNVSPLLILGTDGADALSGSSRDDKIFGQQGDDVLLGGVGRDRISGQGGNDLVDGGEGGDFVSGDFGNDVVHGGAGDDAVYGDDDDDSVFGDDGNDAVLGGTGNDLVSGDAGNDSVFGETGDDRLFGGLGQDYLSGGAGNDVLFGGEGNDALFGNAGNDVLFGGAG